MSYVTVASILFTALGALILLAAAANLNDYECGHVCPTRGAFDILNGLLFLVGLLVFGAGLTAIVGWAKPERRDRMQAVSIAFAITAAPTFFIAFMLAAYMGNG